MKKFISILLSLVLLVSALSIPLTVTAETTKTALPESAYFDFGSDDSTVYNFGEAATDQNGNTFYPMLYYANGTASTTASLEKITVGTKQTSVLHLKGYKDPQNSNNYVDFFRFVPTDKDGHPFIMEPGATYDIEMKWYYSYKPAQANYHLGGGAVASAEKQGGSLTTYGKDSRGFYYGDVQPNYSNKVYVKDGTVTDKGVTSATDKAFNLPYFSGLHYWAGNTSSATFTTYGTSNVVTQKVTVEVPNYTLQGGKIYGTANNAANGGSDVYTVGYDPYLCFSANSLKNVAADGTQADMLIDYISIKKRVPFTGTVNIFNGNKLIKTVTGLTEGGNFPELPIPEAPDGKYFAGYATDVTGKSMLTSLTVPNGLTSLYAVFKDYADTLTDNQFVEYGDRAIYPSNYSGRFYPTFDSRGWSAKGVSDGVSKFYAYSTWGEGGLQIVTDEDGFAAALKPFSKYKLIVKYKVPTVPVIVHITPGYGITADLVSDLTNKNFIFKGDEITYEAPVTGEQTITYEFTTDAMLGYMPFAGVFCSCGALTGGVRNEIDVISMTLEREQIEFADAKLHYNGGFADFDMTTTSTDIVFEVGKDVKLPERAYRLRYAFGGWYTDEALTQKAGGYFRKGEEYYAKWVSYGDVVNDGEINAIDLVRLAKYLAGQKVEISAGADVNGDYTVEAADLVRFKKYLAGQTVIMGTTRYIALTFDDSPTQNVPAIMDAFMKYKGHCTFFCIGFYLKDDTMDIARSAIDNGFELGNHTNLHGNLSKKTDKAEIKAAFNDLKTKFKEKLNYDVTVGRLPELAESELVLETCKEMGIPLFGTNGGPADWSGDCTADMIREQIVSKAVDGAVMCLHATEKTASVIADSLEELHKDGYEFVTVSDLYKIKGYKSIPLGKQLKRATTQKKLIALTFDDGPNENMLKINEQMATVNGHCTYFLIGQNINAGMSPYLNASLEAGHQLASHSYTHSTFTTLTTNQMLEEINKTNDALYAVTGTKTTCFRLPGLGGNETVYNLFKNQKIPLIGGYMGASNDWSGTTTTAEEVANSIMLKVKDGAILCLHATSKTADALKIVLPQIKAMGYEFVTVEELYEQKGYDSIPLGSQLVLAEAQ